MTTDLSTLALHVPYTAYENVISGNGTCLSIANMCSFTLPSLSIALLFTNVLHVTAMSKNLISVSTLCFNNPFNVLFFYSFFQVKDRHSGVNLVCGQ